MPMMPARCQMEDNMLFDAKGSSFAQLGIAPSVCARHAPLDNAFVHSFILDRLSLWASPRSAHDGLHPYCASFPRGRCASNQALYGLRRCFLSDGGQWRRIYRYQRSRTLLANLAPRGPTTCARHTPWTLGNWSHRDQASTRSGSRRHTRMRRGQAVNMPHTREWCPGAFTNRPCCGKHGGQKHWS